MHIQFGLQPGALGSRGRVGRVLGKLIWSDRAATPRCSGIPVAWFRLAGERLRYVGLPIVDELTELPDGSWSGRGLVLGREFRRFRMVRDG
jgi:hypothetical protein